MRNYKYILIAGAVVRDLQESVTTSFIFELFTQKSDDSERGINWPLIYPLGLTEKPSETP